MYQDKISLPCLYFVSTCAIHQKLQKMDGMLWYILHSLFILITCSGTSERNLQCLKWNMQQDRLELICRVSDFSHPVSLIDSHGQMYAQCTFERNIQHCIPVSRNQSIVTYYSLKYVKFTTDGLTKDMNGEWVCLQDVMKSKTYVSLAKGIIDSTELEVHITGKYRNEKDNPRTIISCFSCTEPYGSNVEFLEDKISVDSLTFINDNDTCTHGKGVCHPDECNCTRNIYIRVSLYDTDSNGIIYSCDMLFSDTYTHAKFLITASLFFDGKDSNERYLCFAPGEENDEFIIASFEFHQMNKSTVTIKAGDKMWNETINSNKKIIIEQEEHPTITTPVAKTSDDIATDSEGGLQALEVISIIIACGVFSVFAVIFVHLYHKRRAMIPEGIEIGERKPLIESQNKSTIETQTEDNKKAIATMTEESFSLKVIQEEIVIEERKRFFESQNKSTIETQTEESQNKSTIETQTEDNKIAIATMTEESFLLQVIQEGTEIEEREPLFESQKKLTVGTQTEDNRIAIETMTEESYLLEERSVFKRNKSSNVVNLNTCDPCSFQQKKRLAVFYCIDCEESLCANCSNYHKFMKQTRNHNNISMNKIPQNFSLPLTCTYTDHETMKHEYYCVNHECLCCVRCITSGHAGKGCNVEQIDDASKGFTKTQVFHDYNYQLNRYIDLLVGLSAYQYHMIDQMTNTEAITSAKSLGDNKDNYKVNEVDIQPITNLDDIKLRLNAYATETCYILYSAGEQKGLFDFMKDNGSDRQLFILTHSLRQKLIEIDKRVSELVGNTKNAISYDKRSPDVHTATFIPIERELTNISFHRWRQSQTAVKDPALKYC